MSESNRESRFRLRLFDDSGMPREQRNNLYWVIWSVTIGMLGTIVTTGPVWSAFQRQVLGANDFQLGLLAAIPVGTSVLQIFMSYIMEKRRNRRFMFLFFGILGRSFWILIALVPYVFPGFSIDLRIWLVTVFVVMVFIGNNFVGLSWGSLMGDLVPIRIRGSYFSVRQMISLASGVLIGLMVSVMIDRVGLAGYSIALVLAGIASVADLSCFFFVKWPPMSDNSERDRTSLLEMLKEVFRNRGFVKVVVFYSIWLFCANIAAPFWNVYMIEELKMSFTQMSLYTQIVSNVTTVLVISRWGRLIDRYGNKPILQMAAVLITISPLPWFFATPALTIFVLMSNVISGSSWPVNDVCQQNLYLSHSPRVHRSMYIAVFLACINLFGVATGNAVGGWLMQEPLAALAAKHYTFLGMTLTNTRYLFLLTIVLRIFVVFLILPRISEEGAWTMKAAASDILLRTRDGLLRRYLSIRIHILRKRARSQENAAQQTTDKEE
jgi:MFS family permease